MLFRTAFNVKIFELLCELHPMAAEQLALLDEDQAAFLQSGLSITAGAAGAGEFPSLCRSLGCRVSADRRSISILLSRRQGEELLADVAASGRIAVVFSKPSSHRTIQLKGSNASVQAASVEDAGLARRHCEAFIAELRQLGFAADLVGSLLTCPLEELVVLQFTPDAAFSQTPGPRAGDALRAGGA
jgi:hypothetical protein